MNLIQDQEILISVNGIVKQFFFSPALPDDASAILSLYRSHIGREFCAWTDDYPSADTIRFDLARKAFYLRYGGSQKAWFSFRPLSRRKDERKGAPRVPKAAVFHGR